MAVQYAENLVIGVTQPTRTAFDVERASVEYRDAREREWDRADRESRENASRRQDELSRRREET